MSIPITFNGVEYDIPEFRDTNYANELTQFFVAIPNGVLQPTAGLFTLLAELDFGASFGLKALYVKSRAANPAAAGVFRLGNAENVSWRNAANGADLPLTVDASDNLAFNATKVLLSGAVVNADINASAAIAYSKLALTGNVVNADINASAAIAYTKLAAMSISRALVSDGSGFVTVSATTATEIGYMSGVSSSVQSQIDNRLPLSGGTVTGATGFGGAPPASAQLSVTSTTKGFLPPRMTTAERDLIASPATGLLIYNTTTGAYNGYNGASWLALALSNVAAATQYQLAFYAATGSAVSGSSSIMTDASGNLGVGGAPSFKFDAQGASITGRFRSSTGPLTLDLGTGSNGTTNDVALKLSDGIGATWAIGHDASESNRLSFSASGTLGTNEKLYMTTAGLLRSLYKISVGESWNGDDCPLNINQDGVTTRPGLQLSHRNTAMSRVPVLIAQNFDAAGNGNGNCLAFYGRDGVSDIQHGILAFSQFGATTAEGLFELMLRSGGNSLPCMQMEGTGVVGYAHTLFGPGRGAGDFVASYPYGAYTPSSTVHVASDTGDVDSGIRLQSLRYPGRFNFFIDSSGNMQWREVDVVGKGVTLALTTGKLTVAGQLIGKGTGTNDDAATGYIGEEIENTVSTFTNVGTTLQFADITSISLTAGDWDLAGQVEFAVNTGVSTGEIAMAISINSGNTTTDHVAGKNVLKQRPPVTGANAGVAIGRYRLKLSATTTVYLKGMTSYSSGNPQFVGTITARRMR